MEPTPFEERFAGWASAAAKDWGYPELPSAYLARIRLRLPRGLMAALETGIEQGAVLPVDGHRFTLDGLATGKGPYSWFSRSDRQVPAVNWEYFVQAATFARLHNTLAPKGYDLVFEDDLMDIAIYKDRRLVVCCEVKEKASQLSALLAAIKSHESGHDPVAPDRGNDGLRKAKYIAKSRPRYLALVAIGAALEFSVEYPDDGSFKLTEDVIPIW